MFSAAVEAQRQGQCGGGDEDDDEEEEVGEAGEVWCRHSSLFRSTCFLNHFSLECENQKHTNLHFRNATSHQRHNQYNHQYCYYHHHYYHDGISQLNLEGFITLAQGQMKAVLSSQLMADIDACMNGKSKKASYNLMVGVADDSINTCIHVQHYILFCTA
jgi:hypothetical protein